MGVRRAIVHAEPMAGGKPHAPMTIEASDEQIWWQHRGTLRLRRAVCGRVVATWQLVANLWTGICGNVVVRGTGPILRGRWSWDELWSSGGLANNFGDAKACGGNVSTSPRSRTVLRICGGKASLVWLACPTRTRVQPKAQIWNGELGTGSLAAPVLETCVREAAPEK